MWPEVCAIALISISVLGCSNKAKTQGTGGPGGRGFPVKTQLARESVIPDYTEYIATLQSRGSAVLQPEVEGQIVKIFAKSGQHVKAGAPLLLIDPRLQQAATNSTEAVLRTKQATLDFDRTQLDRQKKLFAAGVISKQDLDQAQTAYDAAKADVESTVAATHQQNVQLRYFRVSAPSDGRIGEVAVRVGDRVATSTILTTIDGSGPLEAYISIPAENAGKVKLGTPVDILDDNGAIAERTRVTFISPRVDTQNQLLLIKSEVPDPKGQIRNEQVVHVHVIWSQSKHVVIPITAIARLGGLTFAFVAEQANNMTVARQRTIKLGEISGNDYVVLEGLNPGAEVITSAVHSLVDGMPVKPE
jgi:RND family efflux transporter MFP subunit